MRTNHDTPWKKSLRYFLPECLRELFPWVYEMIDWSRKIVWLDNELTRLKLDGSSDEWRVDKLVQVWLKSGESRWLWIHIEIQTQWSADFAERMFFYWTILFQDSKQMPLSLAILADDNPKWRPNCFEVELGQCSNRFQFPIAKILDFEARRAELEQSDNPFFHLILAHLDTMATTGDYETRMNRKLELTKNILRRGVGKKRVRLLYHLIDWMMQLPPECENRWYNQISPILKENDMPYVSTAVKVLVRRGNIEAIKDMLPEILQLRFGMQGQEYGQTLQAFDDLDQLKKIRKAASDSRSFDEFLIAIQ